MVSEKQPIYVDDMFPIGVEHQALLYIAAGVRFRAVEARAAVMLPAFRSALSLDISRTMYFVNRPRFCQERRVSMCSSQF
ncbi:unnamed protein product [Calypogeia fissa]